MSLRFSSTVLANFLRDTAGQERYRSLAPMYYRNANCAVVVYDITQSASLTRAKAWVKELQHQANDNIVVALAGNKSDLEAERKVERDVAEAYAKEAGLLFFETSAKTGEGVNELFTAIAKKMPIESVLSKSRSVKQGVDLKRASTNTTSGCNC